MSLAVALVPTMILWCLGYEPTETGETLNTNIEMSRIGTTNLGTQRQPNHHHHPQGHRPKGPKGRALWAPWTPWVWGPMGPQGPHGPPRGLQGFPGVVVVVGVAPATVRAHFFTLRVSH